MSEVLEGHQEDQQPCLYNIPHSSALPRAVYRTRGTSHPVRGPYSAKKFIHCHHHPVPGTICGQSVVWLLYDNE